MKRSLEKKSDRFSGASRQLLLLMLSFAPKKFAFSINEFTACLKHKKNADVFLLGDSVLFGV
jgi:ABC-type uncharacterized transport system ATPase component